MGVAQPARCERRLDLEIVGIEGPEGVHTIDMWFSSRKQCWVVERRDPDGGTVGLSFSAAEEHDAAACLLEWLRSHDETHLVGRAARVALAAAERQARRAA